MGRPLKGATNLSHDVKVRLDEAMFAKLCLYCDRTGKEKATVIRDSLMRYLTEEEKKNEQ